MHTTTTPPTNTRINHIYTLLIGTNTYDLPLIDITPGAHIVSTRVMDADGRWAPTVTNPLYVTNPVDIVDAEYFVDTNLGEGNGTPVSISEDGSVSFSIPTSNLAEGEHRLILCGTTTNDVYLTVFDAPFTVTKNNGVNEIEWNVKISVKHEADAITISGDSMTKGTQVEVYNTSGMCLMRTLASHDGDIISLNTGNQVGPYIIIVTTTDGHRMVYRIL